MIAESRARKNGHGRSSGMLRGVDFKPTLVDRVVGYFSPARGLVRAQARVMGSVLKRSYEGASVGRRTAGWTTTGASANAEIGPALSRLRNRSRDLVRSNGYASSAIEKLVANIIGSGIIPRANTGDEERNKAVDALWLEWSAVCDVEGQLDFSGMQSLATRTTAEAGECLVLMRARPLSDGLPIPMQLQLLEPDHIDTSKSGLLKNSVVLNGVEFDGQGRRVAYWLFPTHPGERLIGGGSQFRSVRFPAENILHMYRKTRPGQVRGVPWLAAIMLRLRDLDEYADAELWRKKVAACFALFVTNPEGPTGDPMGVARTTDTEGVRSDSLEPGLITYLRNGEHIEGMAPKDSGAYSAFMATELRAVAAGIGVTYEQLTNDLSGVNFSSLRAGMQEFRRWAGAVQVHVVNGGFNQPIWRRAMTVAQLAGVLSAGPIGADWTPQRWPFIEPLKDAQADILLARAGFETIPQIMRRYGHNSSNQLAELEEFARELDAAKLILDSDPRRTSRAGLTQTKIDLEGGVTEPDEPEE